MDKKPDDGKVINLGRLDGSAKMPDIPLGWTVTVRLEDRYPSETPAPTAASSPPRPGIPSWGQKYVDNLNKATRKDGE